MGVRPSMGTVGDADDNAMAESFFASLECALIARRPWKTKTEARLTVFTWIESWYNPRRCHLGLNCQSANNFEKKPAGKSKANTRPAKSWASMASNAWVNCARRAPGGKRASPQSSSDTTTLHSHRSRSDCASTQANTAGLGTGRISSDTTFVSSTIKGQSPKPRCQSQRLGRARRVLVVASPHRLSPQTGRAAECPNP